MQIKGRDFLPREEVKTEDMLWWWCWKDVGVRGVLVTVCAWLVVVQEAAHVWQAHCSVCTFYFNNRLTMILTFCTGWEHIFLLSFLGNGGGGWSNNEIHSSINKNEQFQFQALFTDRGQSSLSMSSVSGEKHQSTDHSYLLSTFRASGTFNRKKEVWIRGLWTGNRKNSKEPRRKIQFSTLEKWAREGNVALN